MKFTCKYEIQIENDRTFQVARKIIGPKGSNMKNIIQSCQNQLKNSDSSSQNDFLKLRLRGKGSGFKEGPDQRESDDPMHLCVSSKYQEVYVSACRLVEELLNTLYKEYDAFIRRNGKRSIQKLSIKKIEAGGPPVKQGSDNKPTEINKENSLHKLKSIGTSI